MHTPAAKVWDLPLVQDPFLSPRAKPSYDSHLVSSRWGRYAAELRRLLRRWDARALAVVADAVLAQMAAALRQVGSGSG